MVMTKQQLFWTTEEYFEEFLQHREEPQWLTDKRRAAFAAYQQLAETELDPEEFRRVDLRTLRMTDYKIEQSGPIARSSDAENSLMFCRGDFGGNVSHVDGRLSTSQLTEECAEQGIIFCSLEEAFEKHSDLLEQYWMTKAVDPETDRFSALHAAYCTGGVFLYIPRNVELKKPLHSLISLQNSGVADLSHTLVVVESGASGTLLEETASFNSKAAGIHVGAVELIVDARARLEYVQLQNWNERVFHFAHQCGRVGQDAELKWTVGALGSKLSHVHQDVSLDGRGAFAQVNGVAFATERQKLSYYTKQAHAAPNTTSDLLYKEVVRDRARMIWRGMIEVDEVAQQTDGFQRNDSLILNPDARVDAIPGLEIDADDVRCTHAATAGQVDEDQILYCMSRGISRQESMHAIVEGFFQQVIDRIPVELVRDVLRQSVEHKLGFGG